MIAVRGDEPWRRRLYLPAYRVVEVARYAGVTPQTVSNWQREASGHAPAISAREDHQALSYLQLVEVAFVASMRRLGVRLKAIRDARDYLRQRLDAEFPFATYRFKTDGQSILMDLEQFEATGSKGKLVVADKGGQLAWEAILEKRFTEFDYEEELAARWYVAGRDSPIIIDPQVAYGAPTVRGTATWILKGRWVAGEDVSDIAEDFGLPLDDVERGLRFEGIDPVTVAH